jgi:hypothetical protein
MTIVASAFRRLVDATGHEALVRGAERRLQGAALTRSEWLHSMLSGPMGSRTDCLRAVVNQDRRDGPAGTQRSRRRSAHQLYCRLGWRRSAVDFGDSQCRDMEVDLRAVTVTHEPGRGKSGPAMIHCKRRRRSIPSSSSFRQLCAVNHSPKSRADHRRALQQHRRACRHAEEIRNKPGQ